MFADKFSFINYDGQQGYDIAKKTYQDFIEDNSDEINRENQFQYDNMIQQNDNSRRFMEWCMQEGIKSVTSFDMGGYDESEINPSETIADHQINYDSQQDEINRENEMNQQIMDNMNEDNYINTEINSDFNYGIDNNMNDDLCNNFCSDMNNGF